MEKEYCEVCGKETRKEDNFCEYCGINIKRVNSPKSVPKKTGVSIFLSKKSTRLVCGIFAITAIVLSGYKGWERSQNNRPDSEQYQFITEEDEQESIEGDNAQNLGENFDPRIGEVTENDAIETVKKVVYGGKEGFTYEVYPLGYFYYQVRVFNGQDGEIGDFMFSRETFEVSKMNYGD